ncbi:AraC-type DNA-binding protein [Chitinophaga sp. CF118]|uniref:helix-turn-helix domain-containing protein n=1 Tax=Chitinophaga sp. CF118 TaxID=1884367 RepID=UPI0008EE01C2|nr:AraC family transcriptional regulator [Chitinophaga sp. CF118]SFD02128.1 AraC-type DNA-binding protein [Chitinophaga sp. CF118]
MGTHLFPEDFNSNDSITILSYQTFSDTAKNKITLSQNLFSFLIEGTKSVSYSQKSARIDNTEFLLLSSGNCLMSERTAPSNGTYKSILIFFDNSELVSFFLKHANTFDTKTKSSSLEEPFIVFQLDDFLQNFLASLHLMLNNKKPVSKAMRVLKLEELMLYLCDKYPQEIMNLHTSVYENQDEITIRKTVENNIGNYITIDELAFLCNMSISTFKRKFSKLYGTSPNKWFLQKRMELAASLLRNSNEKPSDIYHKVGYENHSSFTQSFKQTFGLTPSEYQQQN